MILLGISYSLLSIVMPQLCTPFVSLLCRFVYSPLVLAWVQISLREKGQGEGVIFDLSGPSRAPFGEQDVADLFSAPTVEKDADY